MINQGIHAKNISERLGHGNINTTINIYGHALRSVDQAAAINMKSPYQGKGDVNSSRPLFVPNPLTKSS
ncbi:hypothetical protein [Cohnella rhizosphaerae]|uniref:hypothetical protein n=1 Tax=Cohnella rhizosphaerae TaxID=1457232 RepID=UPI003B8A77AD